jgi:hypothetical protein
MLRAMPDGYKEFVLDQLAHLEGLMTPFKPKATQTLKNYYEVPVDIVESAESLLQWARTAACR